MTGTLGVICADNFSESIILEKRSTCEVEVFIRKANGENYCYTYFRTFQLLV